jgi:hypothetical protein
MSLRAAAGGVDVESACRHTRIEVTSSDEPDTSSSTPLPYGHPIVQRGRCAECGATFERRLRIDGWGLWRADEAATPGRGGASNAPDGGGASISV